MSDQAVGAAGRYLFRCSLCRGSIETCNRRRFRLDQIDRLALTSVGDHSDPLEVGYRHSTWYEAVMDGAPNLLADAESPVLCHRLLSQTEYEDWLSQAPARSPEDSFGNQPLTVGADPGGIDQYPAFQLYASLDRALFGVLRSAFRANGHSDQHFWNFLRTAQTTLGGMTAAEYLVGHHSAEVARLTKRDRDEVLLELVQEELWRLQQ